MDIKELLMAAERLQQGLLAKATDGDYADKDYRADLEIVMSDKRIKNMIPTVILVNRTASDFRRAMQAQSPTYAGRRQYIGELLAPIFKYLHSMDSGTDSFSQMIMENELGEIIGSGGFGVVHKYHHSLLDMDFALKLFEPVFVSNEENLEGEKRFFREAKFLFSLNHENIVRVYDIGRYQGKPFIRMEYIDGVTIQKFVERNGTVSFERSLKPIKALLKGLSYAHSLGIVHRDLKPSNLMVTNSKNFKIIDFGISAFLETEEHTKLTQTGEAVAGGNYTDPQLIENPKLRDIRSDIYSVGAIWYYLLVGHAPVGSDLHKSLLDSGNATELEINIILKCLSAKSSDRFSNCEELLNILEPESTDSESSSIKTFKNNITEVTKQAIFDYLSERNAQELNCYIYQQSPNFQEPERVFYYYGKRGVIEFLEKLYDLDNIQSTNEISIRIELWRHTVKNNDYPYEWAFYDERLKLYSGDDEVFLKFLAHMFHPLVRSEKSDWAGVLDEVNELLKIDGYEIYENGKISGKSTFSYRLTIK